MLQNSIGEFLDLVPPHPQFELFQFVRSPYTNEEGESFEDSGFIIGVFYSTGLYSYGYAAGWWYVLYWTDIPSSPGLSVPRSHEVFEAELKAV